MKTFLPAFCIVFLHLTSSAQNRKLLQRDWIKTSIENLSGREAGPDTLYTRYSFGKSKVDISFYPGWNEFSQDWSINGSNLTIGFDTYQVETLNDSVLTISLAGFRRVNLLSEKLLASKEENLVSIGQYNGKPLYRANDFISPRYKGKGSFRSRIQANLEGYHIQKATYFLATFIITEEGKVENVIIRNGITHGFDAEVKRQLEKTSKDWKPAQFKGSPVQVEMAYEIKYLGGLSPFSSGSLD